MMGSEAQGNAPLCKKIDNYVFKFSDLLGQGNFSKVYRGTHELTSNPLITQMKMSPSRSSSSAPWNPPSCRNYFSQKSMCSRNSTTPISCDASRYSVARITAILSRKYAMEETLRLSCAPVNTFQRAKQSPTFWIFLKGFDTFRKTMWSIVTWKLLTFSCIITWPK